MKQHSCNIIVKDTWIMPKANEETTLTLQEPSDLLVGCWLWNPSVGYLEVTKYSGYDIYVTVKNLKMEENAREGTIFPSCMEMLVIAPNATPILNNNVTCLSADFISPEEGSTALMKVVDSSAIKAADLIIVDNKYQYVVIQVIDEHTLEVLNDGKGAEGIIKIDCTGCVSVKIFESTYCCKVLQEEVDDIYNTLNDRHSIKAWNGNNLVTISGGNDALVAPNDATIKVDNDLSKYDNSVTKFSSILNFKESANSSTAVFYPDRSSGLTYYNLGNSSNYYDYAYIKSLQGDGQSIGMDSPNLMYISSTNAIHIVCGGNYAFTFSENYHETRKTLRPHSNGDISLGSSGLNWSNVYTDKITLNGTTYTSIPAPANDGKLTIYNSDGVTPFIEFTADQTGNTSATLPIIPTPATVNDGHLYIYSNSDQVNPVIDFTANQSSDTSAVLADVAFSGSYSDLSDTPTIPFVDSGGSFNLKYFREHNYNNDYASWAPISGSFYTGRYGLGWSGYYFNRAYIKEIYFDDTSNSPIYNINIDNSNIRIRNWNNSDGKGIQLIIGNSGNALFEQRTTLTNPYSGTDTVYYAFIPSFANYGSIGKKDAYWASAYMTKIYARNLYGVNSSWNGAGGDIGSSNNKWNAVYATNFYGTYNPPSDINKKENIIERETQKAPSKSLEKLLSLKTYNYTLKEDVTKQERIGIMAQELREVEPVLVVNKAEEGSKDEDLYYDLTGFVTLIMEAVKELAQDVADLKKALTKGDDNEYKEVSKEE